MVAVGAQSDWPSFTAPPQGWRPLPLARAWHEEKPPRCILTMNSEEPKVDVDEPKIGMESIEAIARRVVELLRTESEARPVCLTDAATLAQELGVERDWIYAHADELGAIRLGGPHGRLRFDQEIVRQRLAAGGESVPKRKLRGPSQRGSREKSTGQSRGRRVKSAQTRQRASGRTPARSPRPRHPGGSPNEEA